MWKEDMWNNRRGPIMQQYNWGRVTKVASPGTTFGARVQKQLPPQLRDNNTARGTELPCYMYYNINGSQQCLGALQWEVNYETSS